MPIAPEVRQKLLKATQEPAAAFLEDMAHFREVMKRVDPSRGELRGLSNELRRLLVDNGGDLPDIAAPRVGRITFLAPDNAPIYKAARKEPFSFFGSGGSVGVFNINIRAVILEKGTKARDLPDMDAERTVELNLDNFLSQKVLCWEGTWITRRHVIKYIANTASGVHSGTPQEDADKILARIRACTTYGRRNGVATFNVNPDASVPADQPFRYEAESIDPVLLELLVTAHCLTVSPTITNLETVVQAELR